VINPKPILSTIIISMPFLLMGCTNNSHTTGTPALFDTKVDAEKAAKNFNCSGAHKMGNKWMPCEIHETNYETEKDQSHTGHHNH
tara:strand:- start:48 stop:302 length:255 start_codon:yes stop_codon:yes gene_type:complete